MGGFLCDALPVPLVWVTGNSGAGKSAVCALLKSLGELAVDADWEGYNHWVDRTSGAGRCRSPLSGASRLA
jgi:hypothetical protein